LRPVCQNIGFDLVFAAFDSSVKNQGKDGSKDHLQQQARPVKTSFLIIVKAFLVIEEEEV
jgi:hypothetical protein